VYDIISSSGTLLESVKTYWIYDKSCYQTRSVDPVAVIDRKKIAKTLAFHGNICDWMLLIKKNLCNKVIYFHLRAYISLNKCLTMSSHDQRLKLISQDTDLRADILYAISVLFTDAIIVPSA
jgi:hypothetical protein